MGDTSKRIKILESENAEALSKIEFNDYLIWPIVKEMVFGFVFNQNRKVNVVKSKNNRAVKALMSVKSIFSLGKLAIKYSNKNKPSLIVTNGLARNYKNEKGELLNIWLDGFIIEKLIPTPLLMEDRLSPINNSAVKLGMNNHYFDFLIYGFIKIFKNKNSATINNKVQDIQNIIKKYNFNIPDNILQLRLNFFFAQKFLYKFIFERIKPKILITYDMLCTGVLAAANELKIPSVDVQHGIIGQYYPTYNFAKNFQNAKHKIALPNKIAVFGELEKEELLQDLFWNEEDIDICGSYRMFLSKNIRISEKRIDILVCTESINPEKMLSIITILIQNKIKIIIKFHPHESKENIYSFMEIQKNNSDYVSILPSDIDLYTQLHKTKIVIGHYSTVLIEAIELGAYAISVEYDDGDNGICKYYRNNILASIINIATPQNIIQTINELLKKPDCEKIVPENFLFNQDYIGANKSMINNILLKP